MLTLIAQTNNGKEIEGYIIQIIGLLLSFLFLWFLKKIKTTLEKKKEEMSYIPISKVNFDVFDQIKTILIRLLINTGSNRSHISEFHNGETFPSSLPSWKMSKTYEETSPGISKELMGLQNIRANTFWDILQPLLDNRKIIKTYSCEQILEENGNDLDCYLYDIIKLNDGVAKYHLERQGIKYLMLCPICDEMHNIIAFIGIDFCSDCKLNKIKIAKYLKNSAEEIENMWLELKAKGIKTSKMNKSWWKKLFK